VIAPFGMNAMMQSMETNMKKDRKRKGRETAMIAPRSTRPDLSRHWGQAGSPIFPPFEK